MQTRINKRILSFVLCMAMLVAFGGVATASSPTLSINPDLDSDYTESIGNFEAIAPLEMQSHIRSDELLLEAAVYAYMDIDTASPRMRSVILEARNTLIFSTSWVVDGEQAGIVHPDGTYEALPTFSELFLDWELPQFASTADAHSIMNTTPNWINGWEYFHGSTFITTPSTNSFGPSFFSYTSQHMQVRILPISIPGAHYNIGILRGGTTPLIYGHNLFPNIALQHTVGIGGPALSLHASTNSTSGTAVFRVEGWI